VTADGPWQKHARLLLRLDGRILWNSLRQQAALSAMMVGVVALFPVLILGTAGDALGGQALRTDGVLTLALVFAFVTALAPFNRPEGAQAPLALPIGDRAVYAHGVMRSVVATSVGYGVLVGPACLILFALGQGASAEIALRLFPVIAALAAVATFGRVVYGVAARTSARLARFLRLAVLGWLSLPALLFVARAGDDLVIGSTGPLGLVARAAGFAADGPPWLALVIGAGMTLAAALAAFVPAAGHGTVARAARRLGSGFAPAGATAKSRAALPRSDPSARRKYEPLPIPRGAPQALRYVSRLWIRGVLYLVATVAAAGAIGILLILWHPPLPRVTVPAVDIRLLMGALYLAFLWLIGLLSAPETQGWVEARMARPPRERKGKMKAIFRVGPPPLILKRWAMLQTMPLERRLMERVFLRPQLMLLALGIFGLWAFFVITSQGLDLGATLATAMAVTLLLMLGGILVASRSGRRFAREHDRVLEVGHSVSAALWMAASLPLSMMGLLVLIQFTMRGTLGLQDAAILGVWAAAAAGMPAYAYYSAYERLVVTQRSFEGKSRVLFLASAGAGFLVVPVVVLVNAVFG
jgi:hypothetical protein